MDDYLQILNEVKPIEMLLTTKEFTVQMISVYYEVPEDTIKSVLKRNMKLLKQYAEIRTVEMKILKHESAIFKSARFKKVRKLSLVNIYGFLRIGLLLHNSIIAREFQKNVRHLDLPERLTDIVIGSAEYKAKEKKLGLFISTAFSGIFSIEQQVKCGAYFIDYVIDKKVAIECDEHGHKYYSKHKELEREEYIKRNGYKLIRFNPDSEESIFKLINRVFMECQTA
ncbi:MULTISPECIES: DUF559 domain-containing protein [Bacillus]|uniref:DUF559 domain-containing protein n=1 Tax=Bacillus TaxID=1386 RepID=UPI0006B0420E|nr:MULTISPECIES: DUF559 domain-containing protein [Bacillus]AWD87901.1 DUF559 domain-containing protein [Bacillus velezensis]KAF6690724.1 DUF559 domain-containing protein [Bacillus sp. EKM601B]MBA9149693.1 DUF559 domain-containing protein [Bacillus sp. EKM213B]MEC1018722.1 DUF559 domain-containing protein [Bacillus velezensis]MED3676595.1 DUF559 domain-containing protein [Bacillus velezensis]